MIRSAAKLTFNDLRTMANSSWVWRLNKRSACLVPAGPGYCVASRANASSIAAVDIVKISDSRVDFTGLLKGAIERLELSG
jgi:hypothetical protein